MRPVTTKNIDYAVKAAMCDGKGKAWTADEQTAARKRIGLGGDFELIEEITLAEEASLVERSVSPSGKAYNLTDAIINIIFPPGSWSKVILYPDVSTTGSFDNVQTGLRRAGFISFSNPHATVSKGAFSRYERKHGKMFMAITEQNFVYQLGEAEGQQVFENPTIYDGENIKAIRVICIDKGNMPIGTKIQVYGVWA